MFRTSSTLLAIAAGLPISLFAAEAAPQPATVVDAEPLVVTASGTAEEAQALPVTVNTLSAERVAANKAMLISETLNQVPGVYFAERGGLALAPAIRMPLTFENYNLFLEDGVPIQSPIFYDHVAFAYSSAMASDGGVEVLKGPGSVLYGSDALGSVINVLSLEPTTTPSGRFRVGGGMYGGREVRADVSSGLTDTQSGRIAVAYDGSEGWQDNTGWDRIQGLARHRYRNDSGTQVDTIATASHVFSEMSGPLDRNTYEDDPSSNGLQPGVDADDAVSRTTYARISSDVQQRVGDGTTIEVVPYVRYVDSTYLEVWVPATTPTDTSTAGTIGSLDRVRTRPWSGGELIVGTDVEYSRLSFQSEQTRPTVTGIYGFLTSHRGMLYDYDVGYLNLAPYAQLQQLIGDHLLVQGGLRYDWARYDYTENVGPTTDPNDIVYRPASRVDHFHQASPKLGASYLVNDDHTVFGRYAHGFRLPMASTLYNLGNGQTSFTLKPERFDSYELGYRGRYETVADWELDGYWVESKDGVVTGVSTPAGQISTNGGRRRYRGIEAGGNFRPGAGVEVGGGYSRTFHRIVQWRADGSDPLDGNVPQSAPENLANARISWRPEPLPALRLELENQWLGQWYIDDANTEKTPNVFVWNARASYQMTSVWSVDAKVLNLFNKHYAASAENTYGSDVFRPGAPFTASGGVEATW